MAHAASPRRAFGHSSDCARVLENEATAIREAADRVLGGDTLSAVVRDWNRRGLTTANGGPWRVNSLSSLLVQPRLAGLSNDLSPQAAGRYPAIIDAEMHARLVALHAERRKGPRRPTRRYLLTGLLRCWRCGGGLRGMPRAKGADLYVCPGPPHGGCSGTAVTADHAEDAIRDVVLARLDSQELARGIASRARAASAHQTDLDQSVSELAGQRRRLDDLADMWASGEISRAEWLALKRKLGSRAKLVEAEAARLARVDSLRALAGTGRALRRSWPAMTVEERRAVLHAVVDHVVVLAAEPPKQVFRPERLQPHRLG
jgi:site-specific DNA recombinase